MAAKTAQASLGSLPLIHSPKEARKQQQSRLHEQMLLMFPCQHTWEKQKNKCESIKGVRDNCSAHPYCERNS